MNYDWNKALSLYYSLTDTQLVWLEEMLKRQRRKQELEMEMFKKLGKYRKYRRR